VVLTSGHIQDGDALSNTDPPAFAFKADVFDTDYEQGFASRSWDLITIDKTNGIFAVMCMAQADGRADIADPTLRDLADVFGDHASVRACNATGATCETDGDCCETLRCNNYLCESADGCESEGAGCSADDDCCAGMTCAGGTCSPAGSP